MTSAEAIELFKNALWTAFLISAPMLGFGLVAGLLVSIFQAVTSIHETTLVFVPKVLAVVVALVVFLPWMLATLVTFTTQLFLKAAELH
jgi:flagellar biosynthesis protein FliQ